MNTLVKGWNTNLVFILNIRTIWRKEPKTPFTITGWKWIRTLDGSLCMCLCVCVWWRRAIHYYSPLRHTRTWPYDVILGYWYALCTDIRLCQHTRAGRAVSFECRYEAMTTHYTSTNHQMDNFPIGDFPMGNSRVIQQCPMSQQVLDVEEEIQEWVLWVNPWK